MNGVVGRPLLVLVAHAVAVVRGDPLDRVADHVDERPIGELEQQLAGAAQALVDAEAAVDARVVDVALPTHGGARLLEVHAHHHQQLAGQRIGHRLEAAGVLHRLAVVVDRAGADHHHQPVVLAGQHAGDVLAGALDHALRGGVHRQLVEQQGRRDQRAHGLDAQVVGAGVVLGGGQAAGLVVVLPVVGAGGGCGHGRSPGSGGWQSRRS